ncbi:DNA polymerase IV [Photobacterium aphoticum]|uniref:DNA polymerase IV n=2 Tax=Photobacterium aphoticum TaxID=754436 RepID=A0A090QX04_9GAMM|nr:DNA polymerase IV [Photobacterium aphoticum]PSU55538.1 DNA polymerase IV [Photobacterium aphoticum]GAL06808.1 DNA polymerase IV [Photobacterium aphoticum]GHA47008.1 DNA polymerase IV [Photobacterium aphoticum]
MLSSRPSAQAEKQRKIIHVDMDCFFAAVEMRDNPALRDIPIAIGGRSEQRGVISTCNYLARKYGVRSAMSTAKAMQLCPHLTLVSGRMEVYKEVSGQIREIFQRYTDKIEPLSLDEAYLDVSECELHHGSATLIAQDIRKVIREELDLTASAGIAPVKFIAKIASDMNKPDGQFVVTPNDIPAFVADLKLEKIPGVGKVTIQKLHEKGLYVGRDVQQYDQHLLLQQFGKFGQSLWSRAHGIDEREVVVERERKSVGVERTFSHNIATFEQCWEVIDRLYPELEKRLKRVRPELNIAKQGVKVKFADFQQTTVEHTQPKLDKEQFVGLLKEALTRQKDREIRLIGISVGLELGTKAQQLSLF